MRASFFRRRASILLSNSASFSSFDFKSSVVACGGETVVGERMIFLPRAFYPGSHLPHSLPRPAAHHLISCDLLTEKECSTGGSWGKRTVLKYWLLSFTEGSENTDSKKNTLVLRQGNSQDWPCLFPEEIETLPFSFRSTHAISQTQLGKSLAPPFVTNTNSSKQRCQSRFHSL